MPCEAVIGEAMGTLMSDDDASDDVLMCAVRIPHSRQVLMWVGHLKLHLMFSHGWGGI